jgi:hypothetical protein
MSARSEPSAVMGDTASRAERASADGIASGMDKQAFLAAFDRLFSRWSDLATNVDCHGCEDCSACVECMFSVGCARSMKLTHSKRCADSFFLTQCVDCNDCFESAYCEACVSCSRSNYLVRCLRCVECDYCFGCVGLIGKDFHILNQPYSRSAYFKIVKALRLELQG